MSNPVHSASLIRARRASPERRAWRGRGAKCLDGYVAGLGAMLADVHGSIPDAEFCGVGLLVCRDVSALPRWPLTRAQPPQSGGDVVATICSVSMLNGPHDGFHILSPDWALTHTNQYIAPPVPPDFRLVVGLPGFGARHMSALLASRLPTVICAGVLNTRRRVLVFADGGLRTQFAP